MSTKDFLNYLIYFRDDCMDKKVKKLSPNLKSCEAAAMISAVGDKKKVKELDDEFNKEFTDGFKAVKKGSLTYSAVEKNFKLEETMLPIHPAMRVNSMVILVRR